MEQTVATKADRARSLAERRVAKAQKAIQQVGRLARHQLTSKQVEQIFTTLGRELDAAEAMFKTIKKDEPSTFKFEP